MAPNVTQIANTDGLAKLSIDRAGEANDLLTLVKDLIVQFIRAADEDSLNKVDGHGLQRPGQGPRATLLEHHPPHKLEQLLGFSLPEDGVGRDGLLQLIKGTLQYSVNTWDQGFLDKLYASTSPVGLAADLILSSLNTNVHVYKVSPVLTVVEKSTAKKLADMFGFKSSFAGGISQPGGSAANQSSMVIARNNMFPETKTDGYGGKRFVIFTSAHGHYSVEKAAQMFGFGSKAIRSVPVDNKGCMRPEALEKLIQDAKEAGQTPFYVSATAGTTVLGSFDPLDAIADICEKHKLWMHVDGSWGAPVIFSKKHKQKLKGIERADTITICPHKMMNVPLTCSLLLGRDLRQFHKGMTLPAGYLFHDASNSTENHRKTTHDQSLATSPQNVAATTEKEEQNVQEFWDLADITPQCGRRGDSLKLALTWQYIGTNGFAAYIDNAFTTAAHLANLIAQNSSFTLVSENPPPCLQVCFYYRKHSQDPDANTRTTAMVSSRLVPRGFMVDYAPGDEGKFLRVVVNGQTHKETVEGLVKAISEIEVE